MAVVDDGAGGRDARTDWTVVERFGARASLLRCAIHTGRTHQIRVHLKSIGHPILGDRIYGWAPAPGLTAPPRVMLHAEHLSVVHPIAGKPLDLRAPLPADFKAQIKELRAGAKERPARPAAGQGPSASAARPQRRL